MSGIISKDGTDLDQPMTAGAMRTMMADMFRASESDHGHQSDGLGFATSLADRTTA